MSVVMVRNIQRAERSAADGCDQPIDVSPVDASMNDIELQDREFFAASRAGRAPNASVASVRPCYATSRR